MTLAFVLVVLGLGIGLGVVVFLIENNLKVRKFLGLEKPDAEEVSR